MRGGLRFQNTVRVTARRNGEVLWSVEANNIMVDVGLDDVLDKYWRGSSYTAAHFVGLADSAPTFAAGDTMGSHAGWAEITNYTEAARPDFTPGAVSGQSINSTANKATFTIGAGGANTGGAFLTTDATKGGAAGVLVAGLAFGGGDRTLAENDTLDIDWTITAANA